MIKFIVNNCLSKGVGAKKSRGVKLHICLSWGAIQNPVILGGVCLLNGIAHYGIIIICMADLA